MAFHGVKLREKDKHHASPSLARQLYQGRLPSEAKTAETVQSRLDKLLEACMPGYGDAFLGQHCAVQLLPKHNNVVDDAMFDALWRYSGIVGGESFPCGVHCWPLPDEERKRMKEALATPAKVCRPEKKAPAEASSSGACSVSVLPKGAFTEAASATGATWPASGKISPATAGGSPATDACVLAVKKAVPASAAVKTAAAAKKAGTAAEWAAAKKPMFLKKWDEAP